MLTGVKAHQIRGQCNELRWQPSSSSNIQPTYPSITLPKLLVCLPEPFADTNLFHLILYLLLPPSQTDTQALDHPQVHLGTLCKRGEDRGYVGVGTWASEQPSSQRKLSGVPSVNEGAPALVEEEGVVYQAPCADRECVYIGKTGGTLEKRLTEHKGAAKRHDVKIGIVVHSWTKQYRVD